MGFLYDLYKVHSLISSKRRKRDFLPWNQYKLKRLPKLRSLSQLLKTIHKLL